MEEDNKKLLLGSVYGGFDLSDFLGLELVEEAATPTTSTNAVPPKDTNLNTSITLSIDRSGDTPSFTVVGDAQGNMFDLHEEGLSWNMLGGRHSFTIDNTYYPHGNRIEVWGTGGLITPRPEERIGGFVPQPNEDYSHYEEIFRRLGLIKDENTSDKKISKKHKERMEAEKRIQERDEAEKAIFNQDNKLVPPRNVRKRLGVAFPKREELDG